MIRDVLLTVTLLSSCAVSALAQAPPHVVFLIGESEYRSEHTMPLIAGELQNKFGMRTTFVFDKEIKDNWEPKQGDRINSLEGIEALNDADLAVFYLRFRTIPKEQLDAIQAYLDAGKPVVAFRTSTHAFNYAPDDELAAWNEFGANVLGAPWIRHYGHDSSTDVTVESANADHPVLTGVPAAFHVRSWLYHVRPDYPPATATILLHGTSVGDGEVPVAEREVNPVAWTNTHPGGGRVFTTTLGHPEDFELDAVRRLAVNGIHWALGLAPPNWDAERPAVDHTLTLNDGDTVLFLGNTFVERDIHHAYLETLLALRHPGKHLVFRNMGWSGDTVDVQMRPLNFGTVEEHVRALAPDVTFVCYGMNESFQGEAGLDTFIQQYAAILDYVQEVSREVILISPIRHENLGPPLPDPAAHNAQLRVYVDAIAQLAQSRGCRFVNLFDTFPQSNTPLTDNGIHLNAEGYRQIAGIIADQILPPAPASWDVSFRARADGEHPEIGMDARGTAITQLHIADETIRFEARDERITDTIHDAAPPRLQVGGLPQGIYALTIDGQPAAQATASEWAGGVALSGGAMTAPAEALRKTVLEKCERYFFRWRAHNGEYIYGRRARTGNGNAGNPQFQDEHAEMDRNIAALDATIADLAQPRPRVYELIRVDKEGAR